jgi:hypothetical protein
MQERILQVCSQALEIAVFLTAAAALTAGVLILK